MKFKVYEKLYFIALVKICMEHLTNTPIYDRINLRQYVGKRDYFSNNNFFNRGRAMKKIASFFSFFFIFPFLVSCFSTKEYSFLHDTSKIDNITIVEIGAD